MSAYSGSEANTPPRASLHDCTASTAAVEGDPQKGNLELGSNGHLLRATAEGKK